MKYTMEKALLGRNYYFYNLEEHLPKNWYNIIRQSWTLGHIAFAHFEEVKVDNRKFIAGCVKFLWPVELKMVEQNFFEWFVFPKDSSVPKEEPFDTKKRLWRLNE